MSIIPWRIRYLGRCIANTRDLRSAAQFVLRSDLSVSRAKRLRYVLQVYRISLRVWCAHTEDEIFQVATAVLKFSSQVPGAIVEAGCYKGGSTAKLSLLARLAGRKLVAYDSFEGLPANDEPHQRTLSGEKADFHAGAYRGGLDEVKANITKFGDLGVCAFVKGWFDETMPGHRDPIVVAFVDVDLVSSTKSCLRWLFPHLQRGGSIFTQDGHLPLVLQALDDDAFWEVEVGRPKPPMIGLRRDKLVQILNRPS